MFEKHNKNRLRDNWNNYKKQRDLCTNLRKKSMKRHFRNVSEGKLDESSRISSVSEREER